MTELKTKVNAASVAGFLAKVPDAGQRADAKKILMLMTTVTKEKPKMWGSSIVGFGQYRYKYASGREGDWMMIGFSPRKQNLTIYLMGGTQQHAVLLKMLGSHKLSAGSCLYLNSLKEIDMAVLKKIMHNSYSEMKKKYS